jgi:hypothetical protein
MMTKKQSNHCNKHENHKARVKLWHAHTLIYMQCSLTKFEPVNVSCVVAEGQLVQAVLAHLKLTADLTHNTAEQNIKHLPTFCMPNIIQYLHV